MFPREHHRAEVAASAQEDTLGASQEFKPKRLRIAITVREFTSRIIGLGVVVAVAVPG